MDHMEDPRGTRRADIAIVGMACRFPGARDVNQYWRLLTAPQPQFSRIPDSRWRAASFLSDNFRDTSAAYTDTMALLPDVGHFDAAHYGIPPRRARAMDPQARLLIDLAREAIQDAGWEADGFDREETSVITALTEGGYRELSTMQVRMRQLAGGEFGARAAHPRLLETVRAIDGLNGTSVAGLLLNMGPNTISSVFDLHGESYALDSACSGGLMAVANAVHALRAGRSRIALAGGAQLVLTPDLLVGLCRIGAISRSGRCLPFGAEADGFVLGEGAGVLVLRPLADALAAGDRVYAVIRGVGTANDGTVQGGMHPQAAGQLRTLRRAYRDAGLAPDAVGYLEAHGTGTTVGDPVELAVLRELRGHAAEPAYLGAVKAVVGHSLNSAGIAGLIKSVLAVQRGVIPPQPESEGGPADRAASAAAAVSVAAVSVASVVLEEVSRTGVFPLSELREQMLLVDDLGFDSLMLQELEVNIGKRIPGARAEELFSRELTLGRLIEALDPDHPRTAAAPAEPAVRPPTTEWDPRTAAVDAFPEVGELEQRLGWITDSGAQNPYFRVHEGTIRDTTVIGGRACLSFGSYNYLGLSGHPAVNGAVHRAVDRYGTSVSASRVLSGERDLTVELERALAQFLGVGDCLTLVSGHATNVTAIGHLVGPGDLVLHDSLAHDSILQGCALSGAARRPFAHNDMGQLEHMLRINRSRFRRVLIAVEGAYSMDGDLAELPAVIELKKRYGALLLVDEAHSIGTVGERGRGVGEFFGVDRSDVDLWMGTLSKAFASCGGYLGGSARMVRWLRHTLPGFVYSVGLTPANAAAALAATELITAEPQRVRALRRNSELFLGLAAEAGLATGASADTPIIPCILGDSAKTLRVADELFARGVIADPIFHPAVAEDLTRLRFFVTSEHHEDDIRRAVSILAEEVAAAGR